MKNKMHVSIWCQQKGGVGKTKISGLKLLKAIQNELYPIIVLLDSSQRANQNYNNYLNILEETKIKKWDILSDSQEYKRSHFFDLFSAIRELESDLVIVDAGAAESNTLLLALELEKEFTAENLFEFASEENLQITFNIIISGADDNVKENISYFNSMNKLLGEYFTVNCVINDYTFKTDSGAEILAKKILEAGIAKAENIVITGYTGNRGGDNAYLDIVALTSAEMTYSEAIKNPATKIRLRNIFKQLNNL